MIELKRPVPAGTLAFGALFLALGLWQAGARLPEWRVRPPQRNPEWIARLRREMAVAGGELGSARLVLGNGPSPGRLYERAFRRLGSGAAPYLAASGLVAYRVKGQLDVPGKGPGGADLFLDPGGNLVELSWSADTGFFSVTPLDEKGAKAYEAFLARLRDLLRGDRVPAGESTYNSNNVLVRVVRFRPRPGEPAQSLVEVQPPGSLQLSRELADPNAVHDFSTTRGLRKLLVAGVAPSLLVVTVLVLFSVLLAKKRISFRIALSLALLALASMAVGGLGPDSTGGGALVAGMTFLGRFLAIGFLIALWSVGESLVRDTVPGFTTSLDSLAAGRLGPRGGRALLAGLGAGAALLGIRLLSQSAAAALYVKGVVPTAPSFTFPLFQGTGSPFYDGPFQTAEFVLFVAMLRFVLPRRWADPLGALLFAIFTSIDVPVSPWHAAFAVALAGAILRLFVFQRFGFAALLAASTAAPLLCETLAATRFAGDSVLPLLFGALALGLLAALGLAGVRRSPRDEEGRIEAPEYLRRLESQRRVKYEMDLLSRMQLALLPEQPPDVKGLDLSVRTILATEAGGDLYDFIPDGDGALWIAAGDVSGHGYSCGIQQAMVKAALMSLVKAGREPGEILCEVDRVLRSGRSGRLFTTLALLRLDPATGRGLFASAGHPPPLLVEEGRCREISSPGLPLGQGPARDYASLPLELPPGSLLVFASDGLYEGPDLFDEPYGYERPRRVLESVGLWRRPAESIVDALFADWRLHTGEGAPVDDTTVLAVKRPLFA